MKPKTMQLVDTKNISKECKITFIFGNGLDLSLGMKTKYTDVYEDYIKSPSSSDIIANFKEDLKSKSPNNYKKWSDFEMGMASYAKTLETEDELVECVRDFKSFMVKHLEKENKKILEWFGGIANNREFHQEVNRSFYEFYRGLIPNDIARIKSIIGENKIIRNYLTFNYTLSLEAILSFGDINRPIFENAPIHIHGKLGEDVVLGVDDIDQLRGTKYNITRKGERAFVKTLFNKQFDSTRVENATKAIMNSSIICVYGFSMGESDNTWIWLLSDWLEKDKNHHLVFYKHDTPIIGSHNYDQIMDIEDEVKVQLLKKLQVDDDSVLDQIHIPIGKKLFNFSFKEIEPHTLKKSTEFNPLDTYESKAFVMN